MRILTSRDAVVQRRGEHPGEEVPDRIIPSSRHGGQFIYCRCRVGLRGLHPRRVAEIAASSVVGAEPSRLLRIDFGQELGDAPEEPLGLF